MKSNERAHPVGHTPQLDQIVTRTREKVGIIRRPLERRDGLGMTPHDVQLPGRRMDFPDDDGPVAGGRGEVCAAM